MSYFIFDHAKKINVFANTTTTDHLANQRRVRGTAYHRTKALHPLTMKVIFERDIQQAISDGLLPKMIFQVTVARPLPTPSYQVEIFHIAEPIVLRLAEDTDAEISCEPSSLGRIQLTELALYVRLKIMQILWKYNADLITTRGIYGHPHFSYQILLTPDLIERQVKSFDFARRRTLRKESEKAAIGMAA